MFAHFQTEWLKALVFANDDLVSSGRRFSPEDEECGFVGETGQGRLPEFQIVKLCGDLPFGIGAALGVIELNGVENREGVFAEGALDVIDAGAVSLAFGVDDAEGTVGGGKKVGGLSGKSRVEDAPGCAAVIGEGEAVCQVLLGFEVEGPEDDGEAVVRQECCAGFPGGDVSAIVENTLLAPTVALVGAFVAKADLSPGGEARRRPSGRVMAGPENSMPSRGRSRNSGGV